MNKLFGLAIAVVVVVALLAVFKEQTLEITEKLFGSFGDAIDDNLILALPSFK